MLIEGYSSLAEPEPVAAPVGPDRRHRVQAHAVPATGRSQGHDRQRLQLHAVGGGKAAGGRTFSGLPVRRRVPGFAQGISRGHQGAGGQGAGGPAHAAPGLLRPGGHRPDAGPARPGDHFAEFDFRVRAHRQRQDQPGRADAARLSGRRPDSLRGGSGQPDHQLVRSGGAPAARKRRTRTSTRAGFCASAPASWSAAS